MSATVHPRMEGPRSLPVFYRADDAREFLAGAGLDVDAIAPEVDGKFRSAFIRARKPGA